MTLNSPHLQVVELKGPLKVFASSMTATDSETKETQKLYSYLVKYAEFNSKLEEVALRMFCPLISGGGSLRLSLGSSSRQFSGTALGLVAARIAVSEGDKTWSGGIRTWQNRLGMGVVH